jgi:hypothetical protein
MHHSTSDPILHFNEMIESLHELIKKLNDDAIDAEDENR